MFDPNESEVSGAREDSRRITAEEESRESNMFALQQQKESAQNAPYLSGTSYIRDSGSNSRSTEMLKGLSQQERSLHDVGGFWKGPEGVEMQSQILSESASRVEENLLPTSEAREAAQEEANQALMRKHGVHVQDNLEDSPLTAMISADALKRAEEEINAQGNPFAEHRGKPNAQGNFSKTIVASGFPAAEKRMQQLAPLASVASTSDSTHAAGAGRNVIRSLSKTSVASK